MTATYIHPNALVESGVELGVGVHIGPFCTVAAGVHIGDRSKLISHVVVEGKTTIGPDNLFYPFCSVGAPPQDLTYGGEATRVVIAHGNVFREGVSIHRGTAKDRAETTIGHTNYIMAYSHVAHDCVLGNHIIIANQTALAGHVQIFDRVNIGGQSAITQRARIGELSFLGAGSIIRRDVPPYFCAKEFSQVTGPNLVGMKRAGMTEENIRVVIEVYKIIYLGNLTTEKALGEVKSRFPDSEIAARFVSFVGETKIGIQR